MKCIALRSGPTSSFEMPSSAVAVSPGGLLSAFANVPDPRRRQGTRFALSAILALAVAAILCKHLSVLAIAEWGASQCRDLLQDLGFADGVTPRQSTLQRLFRRLDADALSQALTTYFARAASGSMAAESGTKPRLRGSEGVSIDGKAQRGRLAFDSAGCPVHALAAFVHDRGIVLAQEPIDASPQTPADASTDSTDRPTAGKAEAELSVAPSLIRRVDWQGRVLTGDALFCQRSLCNLVVGFGGDYLLVVKENQPTLYEDIRLLFDPPPGIAVPLSDRREVETIDNGHGRHHDTRRLIASTDLTTYSDWPHLAQVFRLERTWEEKGRAKCEVRYGITSLPSMIAGPDRLLALKRGHWQIENCVHYVKDVTLEEDRSPIHLGNGPSVLAILRDLALNILHQAGFRAIASRLRYNSSHPEAALALLLAASDQNA